MNNMNFFSWIRDGVRQSVLMGVSDAVNQLGAPPTDEELHPSVTAFLADRNASGSAGSPRITDSTGKKTGGRKRLGKSLKDIGAEGSATT